MVVGDLNLPSSLFVAVGECSVYEPPRMASSTEPVGASVFSGLAHWLATLNSIVLDLGLLFSSQMNQMLF